MDLECDARKRHTRDKRRCGAPARRAAGGQVWIALCEEHMREWQAQQDDLAHWQRRYQQALIDAENMHRALADQWASGFNRGTDEGYKVGYADGVANRPAKRMQTYVVAQGEAVKIGRSTWLEKRLRELARPASCIRPPGLEPGEVVLLFAVDGDVENEWHRRWDRCRLRPGEWFLPDAQMRGWIEERRAATRG